MKGLRLVNLQDASTERSCFEELNNKRIENTDEKNEYKPDTKARKKKCLILSKIHTISFSVNEWVSESNWNTNN